LIENLRYYLNSDEIYLAQTGGRPEGLPRGLQFPLYLGEAIIANGKGIMYNTGGPGRFLAEFVVSVRMFHKDATFDSCCMAAYSPYPSHSLGYLFNKAALKLLVTEALPAATGVAARTTSAEDLKVADTFQQYVPNPVMPYPTRDASFRNRFNTFAPARLYVNHIPFWYRKYGAPFIGTFGRESYSNESISFHYMNKEELRRAHVFRYLCPQARTRATTGHR
jgi:hypothetical protein